jgi:hypothetical protein
MNHITSYTKLEDLGRVRLSTNFFMRDFLQSEIAAWHGLRNIPDYPEQAVYAGSQLCERLLEPLQATFGRVHIRSGYRAPAVNEFGNANDLNCASNAANHAGHIWDYPDARGKRGATACIVLPWLIDHMARGGNWTDMAWWIHDHLPYSTLYFFPRLAAFNINWHEEPVRRVDSYAPPKGCLIRPGTAGAVGMHAARYPGFPALQAGPSGTGGSGAAPAEVASVAPGSAMPASEPKPQAAAKTAHNPSIAEEKATIYYRAVHSKTRWRKVNSHGSLESAISGVNGAASLFAGKVRIDYDKHGEPLYVLVWQSGAPSGLALRRHGASGSGLQQVAVPVEKLWEFERQQGGGDLQLSALFN